VGCDYYSIESFFSSGYAVMVFNQDIKEVHCQGSSNTGSGNTDIKLLKDPLDDNETTWLLGQAEGFKVYGLGASFCLFMKEKHDGLLCCPSMTLPGLREIDERVVEIEIEEAPQGDEFDVLSELARKLTPQGRKLSLALGRYTFSSITELIYVKELTKTSPAPTECDTACHFPFDFEIVVGEGEKKKTIQTNKAILPCFLPKFESRLDNS
jgi:hypothetical protein